MTSTQLKALKAICDAVIESVKLAGPLGAPAGTLYAAMMTHGFTLEQFERLMNGLVSAKMLRKSGNLYFAA